MGGLHAKPAAEKVLEASRRMPPTEKSPDPDMASQIREQDDLTPPPPRTPEISNRGKRMN
jgi:hypothetical protein